MATYGCEYNPLGKIYVDDRPIQKLDGQTGIESTCYSCLNVGFLGMKLSEVVTPGHQNQAKAKVIAKCKFNSKNLKR